MELFPIDPDQRLFISPAIDDWQPVHDCGISAVIDLEGGIDACIPTTANEILYVYFPILDTADLPDLHKLHAITHLGARLIAAGNKVLSHCGMGFNRSALVAGLILTDLGMTGEAAVALLREKRPGALYNEVFAEHIMKRLPAEESANRSSTGHK
jgi:protein-tyrosine phosphatase